MPDLNHDPLFSPPPSARELALASDAELDVLYHVLRGTPQMEVMRRLVRAAYEGVQRADGEDQVRTAAITLLQETQRRAPDSAWARRRDTLLQEVAKQRAAAPRHLGALLEPHATDSTGSST